MLLIHHCQHLPTQVAWPLFLVFMHFFAQNLMLFGFGGGAGYGGVVNVSHYQVHDVMTLQDTARFACMYQGVSVLFKQVVGLNLSFSIFPAFGLLFMFNVYIEVGALDRDGSAPTIFAIVV